MAKIVKQKGVLYKETADGEYEKMPAVVKQKGNFYVLDQDSGEYDRMGPINAQDVNEMLDQADDYLREFLGGATANLSNYIEAWIFDKDIEEIRENREAFKEENPGAAVTLDILGMAATGFGAAGLIGRGALTFLSRFFPTVAAAVANNLVRELGEKGAKAKYGEALIVALIEAATGFGAGRVVQKLGKQFTKAAEKFAYRSLSPTKATYQMTEELGRRKVGRILLDEEVVKALGSRERMKGILEGTKRVYIKDPELIRVLDVSDIAPKDGLIAKYAKDIEKNLKLLDEAAEKEGVQVANMEEIAAKLKADIEKEVGQRLVRKPKADAMMKAIDDELEEIGVVGLTDINNLKKGVGRDLGVKDWTGVANAPAKKEALKRVYRELKGTIEEIADDLSADLGEAKLGQSIARTNEKLGGLIDARNILDNAVAAEQAKKMMPSDFFQYSTGAAAASGLPPQAFLGGAGVMGVGRAVKSKGYQTAARVAETTGQAMRAQALPQVGAVTATTQDMLGEAQAAPPQPIPRTAQGLIDNQEAVAAHIAERSPQMAQEFLRLVRSNDRAKLERLIPEIVKIMPDRMEDSPMQISEGKLQTAVQKEQKIKIMDPMEKQMVIGDILKDDTLSQSEKTQKIDELNKFSTVDVPPSIQQETEVDQYLRMREEEPILLPPIEITAPFRPGMQPTPEPDPTMEEVEAQGAEYRQMSDELADRMNVLSEVPGE